MWIRLDFDPQSLPPDESHWPLSYTRGDPDDADAAAWRSTTAVRLNDDLMAMPASDDDDTGQGPTAPDADRVVTCVWVFARIHPVSNGPLVLRFLPRHEAAWLVGDASSVDRCHHLHPLTIPLLRTWISMGLTAGPVSGVVDAAIREFWPVSVTEDRLRFEVVGADGDDRTEYEVGVPNDVHGDPQLALTAVPSTGRTSAAASHFRPRLFVSLLGWASDTRSPFHPVSHRLLRHLVSARLPRVTGRCQFVDVYRTARIVLIDSRAIVLVGRRGVTIHDAILIGAENVILTLAGGLPTDDDADVLFTAGGTAAFRLEVQLTLPVGVGA